MRSYLVCIRFLNIFAVKFSWIKTMRRKYSYILMVFTWGCMGAGAQEQDLNFNEAIRKLIESGGRQQDTTVVAQQDTVAVTAMEVDESEPLSHDRMVRDTILPRKEVSLEISEQAHRIAHESGMVPFDEYMTYEDTLIVSPLFMPVLFRAEYAMPMEEIALSKPFSIEDEWQLKPSYEPARIFEKETLRWQIEESAARYLQQKYPKLYQYSAYQLPSETTRVIQKQDDVTLPVVRKDANPTEYTPPTKFIPDRKYWTSSFASSVQFAQKHLSPNWYQGGTGYLNLFTKNMAQYDYAKDPILFKNLLELNAGVFNATNDTLRNYKLGDNLFRIYSNFGYKAFSKWYYTFDFEFKTQMFTNYQENTMYKQSALLSPYTVSVSLGMKYDYNKPYTRKDRQMKIAVNLAPLSYTYMYSMYDDIDLGRQGFQKNEETGEYERRLSTFGSQLRFDMTWKPSRNVVWVSRFFYSTSYERVIGEFENTLDLAISRFFSTKIYLYLRYDDGVAKVQDYNSLIQINELLSFGFSYRW
jgi:hypothetical protein